MNAPTDIIKFQLARMSDEHMAMQEAMMEIPPHAIAEYLDRLERHAIAMSQLAGRLLEAER